MSRKQNISWNVKNEDLSYSPLGYEVELGDDAFVSTKSIKHNTADGVGEFEVSMNGSGTFIPFPQSGLSGATTNTVVRMLKNGENPTSNILVGKDSFLYKMSLDCSKVMLEKRICETNVYTIDSISCDNLGKVWVKDSGGVMTVLDRHLKVLNTFRLLKSSIFSIVDPLRRLLWQVSNSVVTLIRIEDMSIIMTALLPDSISAVTDWAFSDPSGTLFMVLDNSTAVAVSKNGVLTSICSGATGICQWGARGALVCVPTLNKLHYFDGSYIAESFPGSTIHIFNPSRISNISNRGFIVSNSAGNIAKIDSEFRFKWSVNDNPLAGKIDIHTTQNQIDLGGVFYLSTTDGVASYRDLVTEARLYGFQAIRLPSGREPSSYPIISVMPELKCAHMWAKITPTETT